MNLRKVGISIALLASVTLLLSACTSTSDNKTEKDEKGIELAGVWNQVDPNTLKPTNSIRGQLVFLEGAKDIKENSSTKVDVSGNDGCNNLRGEAVVNGITTKGDIVFDGFASTMMFCEGVNTEILQAATGKYDKGMMTVFDTDGKTVATLKKSNEKVEEENNNSKLNVPDGQDTTENTEVMKRLKVNEDGSLEESPDGDIIVMQ